MLQANMSMTMSRYWSQLVHMIVQKYDRLKKLMYHEPEFPEFRKLSPISSNCHSNNTNHGFYSGLNPELLSILPVFFRFIFDQTLGSKRTCWQDVLKLWSKNLPIKNFKDVSLELNLYGGFAILIIFKLSPNWALFLTHDYFWNGYRKRWMNSCKKSRIKII